MKLSKDLRSSSCGAAQLYAGVLFLTYAVMVLAFHASPSLADYSDWTYEGVLLRGHLLGHQDTHHLLKHYPVPNSATTIGVAVLATLMPWQMAARVWLCLFFGAAFLSAREMMKSCGGSAVLWLIAPGAIFLNVNLWYGFINFELGICWVLLIGSYLLRGVASEWVLGLLLALAFFSHMVPFAFAVLMVAAYALQSGRLRLLWQVLPSSLLTLGYVVGRFTLGHDADGQVGMVSSVRTYSGAFWAYKVNSYIKSFGFINPGTSTSSVSIKILGETFFVILLALNCLLCAIAAWWLGGAMIDAYSQRRKERFLWTAALVCLPVYLVVPGTTLGISDPGSRILQVALAVTLFLTVDRGKLAQGAKWMAAGCAMVLQLAGAFLFSRVVSAPIQEGASVKNLPRALLAFAHVPNHAGDAYLKALQDGDMSLKIFPTGMFLNTAAAAQRNDR